MSVTASLLFGCLGLIVLVAIVSVVTGRDIDRFERMRALAPKQYLGMKRTLKFNGPMVGLMCAAFMIGSPIAALFGDITAPRAALVFAGSCVFLCVSVRWTRWAYS